MPHIMHKYKVVFNYPKGSVTVHVNATTSKHALLSALDDIGDEPFIGVRVAKELPSLPPPKKEGNIIHLYHE